MELSKAMAAGCIAGMCKKRFMRTLFIFAFYQEMKEEFY